VRLPYIAELEPVLVEHGLQPARFRDAGQAPKNLRVILSFVIVEHRNQHEDDV